MQKLQSLLDQINTINAKADSGALKLQEAFTAKEAEFNLVIETSEAKIETEQTKLGEALARFDIAGSQTSRQASISLRFQLLQAKSALAGVEKLYHLDRQELFTALAGQIGPLYQQLVLLADEYRRRLLESQGAAHKVLDRAQTLSAATGSIDTAERRLQAVQRELDALRAEFASAV